MVSASMDECAGQQGYLTEATDDTCFSLQSFCDEVDFEHEKNFDYTSLLTSQSKYSLNEFLFCTLTFTFLNLHRLSYVTRNEGSTREQIIDSQTKMGDS